MIFFYVDTNLFLQCLDLRQIPWIELGAEDVILLVPRTVCEEVDQLKSDGKTRRAKRARKASALFREIVLSPELSIVIREADPRVTLSFPAVGVSGTPLPSQRGDDRIIDELLRHKSASPSDDIRFLSHDTYPLLLARRTGVLTQIIPDSWLLPPEPDQRDRQISELERRVTAIEARAPDIRVEAIFGGVSVERIERVTRLYPPIPQERIGTLLEFAKAEHPRATTFKPNELDKLRFAAELKRFSPPDPDVVAEYNRKYDAWISGLGEYLANLPQEVDSSERHTTFELSLKNVGEVPAHNLLLEVQLTPGLKLVEPDEDEDQASTQPSNIRARLPAPPKPPRGTWESRFPTAANVLGGLFPSLGRPSAADAIASVLSVSRPPARRDRHSFYWKGGRPSEPVANATLECEELRHKVEASTILIKILADPESDPSGGELRCRITASNLPEPRDFRLVLTFPKQTDDAVRLAEQLIQSL